MDTNNKATIFKGLSILLITTGVVFVVRTIIMKSKRKKDALNYQYNDPVSTTSGSGGTALTNQEEADAKNYDPTADVNYLYSLIAGANFFYYPTEINGRIASLTDAQVKKLADAYKRKNGGVSLWVALDDEWGDYYAYSQNRLSSLGKK